MTWASRTEDSGGLTSPEPTPPRTRPASLDGALPRPRAGRDAAGQARHVRDGHLRTGGRRDEDRADRAGHCARSGRGRSSRRPRAPRRTAHSRRRLPRCPRSRSTRASPNRGRSRARPGHDRRVAIERLVDELIASMRRRRSACPTLRSTTTIVRVATRAGGQGAEPKRLADEWRQAQADLERCARRFRPRELVPSSRRRAERSRASFSLPSSSAIRRTRRT